MRILRQPITILLLISIVILSLSTRAVPHDKLLRTPLGFDPFPNNIGFLDPLINYVVHMRYNLFKCNPLRLWTPCGSKFKLEHVSVHKSVVVGCQSLFKSSDNGYE